MSSISDLAGLSDEEPKPDPKESASVSAIAPTDSTDASNVISEPTSTDTKDTDIPKDSTVDVDTPASAASATPATKPRNEFLDVLMSKLAPVGSETVRPPLKMMLYSLPGAGKTTLMGQIPNNMIIDTEQGRLTLEENKKHQPDLISENVQVIPYKTFEGLEMIIKTLHDAPPELASFETVTIDTLNNLQKRATAAITEREWNKNPISINRYVPETEHYTEANELIRRLVQSMADLDRNIMLMAHSRTIEPKNQTARTFPDFSEKLANTVASMVDVVGYMYMAEIEGEQHRVIKFKASGTVTAKSRIKALPDNMIDPTWDKIWEAFTS